MHFITLLIFSSLLAVCWPSKVISMQEEATPSSSLAFASNKAILEEEAVPDLTSSPVVLPFKNPPSQFWGITNEHLEDLFEHSNDLVCIMNYGDRFVRLNKNWRDIFGYEEPEFKAVPYLEFVHPKDVKKTLAFEQNKTTSGLVNRYRTKQGFYRWLDWIGIPNVSRDKDANLHFAIARDVTLQKTFEKEIGKKIKAHSDGKWISKTLILQAVAEIQAAQLSDLLEAKDKGKGDNQHSLDVVLQNFIRLTQSEFGFIGEIFYDLEGNPSFVQHWDANVLASEDARAYCHDNNLHWTKGMEFRALMDRVIQEKVPLYINNFQEAFPGEDIPKPYQRMKTFLAIPLLNQGELMGIIGLSNRSDLASVVGLANCLTGYKSGYKPDLLEWLEPVTVLAGRVASEAKRTRWKEEMEKERQARLRAVEENRIKNRFIAHMSHEIRTPLSGVMGHLDLIDERTLNQDSLNHVHLARFSAQSLLHISNDILDVARLEAGIFRLEEKDFSLQESVRETFDILKPSAEAKNLTINSTFSPDLPDFLKGDPLRLRQILFNLVNNSIKFTQKGSINASFSGQPDREKEGGIILSGVIKDTGIGMDEITLARLFQPFSQGDDSIYRQFGGTGLGLYITRQICQVMGGDVSALSNLKEGSTFTFTVKVSLAPSSLSPVMPLKFVPFGLPPSLKVLVVDDNLLIQTVLRLFLKKLGCEATIAANGLEACEAVQAHPYDLILMDGEMPVMNGLEATRKIRETFTAQTLPIIGITAHALTTNQESFMDAGMNGYLTKPVKPQDLKTEILRVLASVK